MSKYFTSWAIEDERQALKVLGRMLRAAQGARIDQEREMNEVRAAAAEAQGYHPQSAAIRTFAQEL